MVRPWSWPCVLVFVRRWRDKEVLGANLIPRALYMPDGRVVLTCVVLAPPDESPLPPAPGPAHASPMLGGGYGGTRLDQGIERVGSFACLVYKGGTLYALTSRHVAGEPGREIRAFVSGENRRQFDRHDRADISGRGKVEQARKCGDALAHSDQSDTSRHGLCGESVRALPPSRCFRSLEEGRSADPGNTARTGGVCRAHESGQVCRLAQSGDWPTRRAGAVSTQANERQTPTG